MRMQVHTLNTCLRLSIKGLSSLREAERDRGQVLNPRQHRQQTGAQTWCGAGAPRLAAPRVPGAHRRGEDTVSPLGGSGLGVPAPEEMLLRCSASRHHLAQLENCSPFSAAQGA